jgi:hypothetical protein
MKLEPDTASDYGDREVQAVTSVLLEIGQVLGAYKNRFVIVGGAVPWLLFPNARPAHVGTLDIDLNLDPDALADGEYANLVESLETVGYERNLDGMRPFQLRRSVTVDAGEAIAVIVDLLMPRTAKPQKNRPPLLEDFRVQSADGGELALKYSVTQMVQGRMPDGRKNRVELLVAQVPAFLVMKGYALVGRDKKKDAYDVYYSIRNFEGGPVALAESCRELLEEPGARKAYQHIAEKFDLEDGFGPQTVRAFVAESNALGEMTADQVQVDAFQQVRAWARALLG